jgi:hypothetical protein
MRYLTLLVLLATGCAAHYAVPGTGAKMEAFGVGARANATDSPIRDALAKKPLASFPTGIAVARVQGTPYDSRTVQTWGRGRYCVVTTRDIEKSEHVDRLAKMPMVIGVAPVNRLLLPMELHSDLELRQAAATLHADLLLIYTIDTSFNVDDKAAPLTVISLGLSPNQVARVNCTASALLMDTRNGYIYGVAEASDRSSQLANAWTSEQAVDDARRRVESRAFDKLVGELEKTWTGVVHQYAGLGPAGPKYATQ